MIIIGVDPGTNVTGYGLVRAQGNRLEPLDYGCIRPPRKERLSQRRRIIFEGLSHLLDRFEPEALAVETQYLVRNPASVFKLAMVRGIVALAATLREIPVFEYAPSKIKKAVSGRGGASKAQVQGMVRQMLGLAELPPEDAADALALAISHLHSQTGAVSFGQEL